jgi:hypothetical protein
MQEVKLSDETIQTLSNEISNKVCNRIGDALMITGAAFALLSITFGFASITINYMNRNRDASYDNTHSNKSH